MLEFFFSFSSFSHVILPKELAKTLPKSRLLTESEWRGIGVQQSRGWQHYAIHRYVLNNPILCRAPMQQNQNSLFYLLSYSPEPHILLFRRPLGTDPQSGRVDPELERQAREDYRSQYGRK